MPRDISEVSSGHECRRPSVTRNIREGQGFQRSGLFSLKWQGITKTKVASVKKIQRVECKCRFQDLSNQMGCTAAQSFINCWSSLGKRKFQIPSHSLSTFSWISLAISGEVWKWYVCNAEERFSVDAAVPGVLKVAEIWTVQLCKTRRKEIFSLVYHYCYLQCLLSCAELKYTKTWVKSSGKHKNMCCVQLEIQFNLHYSCLNLCFSWSCQNYPKTLPSQTDDSQFILNHVRSLFSKIFLRKKIVKCVSGPM